MEEETTLCLWLRDEAVCKADPTEVFHCLLFQVGIPQHGSHVYCASTLFYYSKCIILYHPSYCLSKRSIFPPFPMTHHLCDCCSFYESAMLSALVETVLAPVSSGQPVRKKNATASMWLFLFPSISVGIFTLFWCPREKNSCHWKFNSRWNCQFLNPTMRSLKNAILKAGKTLITLNDFIVFSLNICFQNALKFQSEKSWCN